MTIANIAPEREYFERLVELETERQGLAEDIKAVCEEAKEADIDVKALRLAVKRHMETPEKRMLREETESEAKRILAALREFVNTPLGEAAVRSV